MSAKSGEAAASPLFVWVERRFLEGVWETAEPELRFLVELPRCLKGSLGYISNMALNNCTIDEEAEEWISSGIPAI